MGENSKMINLAVKRKMLFCYVRFLVWAINKKIRELGIYPKCKQIIRRIKTQIFFNMAKDKFMYLAFCS